MLPHHHAALLDKRANFYVALNLGFFYWQIKMYHVSTLYIRSPFIPRQCFRTMIFIQSKEYCINSTISKSFFKIFFIYIYIWKAIHEFLRGIRTNKRHNSYLQGQLTCNEFIFVSLRIKDLKNAHILWFLFWESTLRKNASANVMQKHLSGCYL